MSSVHIRPALPPDVLDIQSCARRAYLRHVARVGREPAPMHSDFGQQIANDWVHVAIWESRLVGYVVFYPEGDHIHLESVAVLPDCSGRGVGKQLIAHVERAAAGSGYHAVELYTNEAMAENLAMYAKLGYVEIRRRSDAGFNRVYFRKEV